MSGVYLLAYRATKGLLPTILVLIVSFLALKVNAGIISNKSDDCSDVIILFARGSSSNPNNLNTENPFSKEFEEGIPDPTDSSKRIGAEEVPGAFFRWMETNIRADYPHIDYKAISIHNSAKGWSINGYPAVGIFGGSTIHNMLDAEWAWWPAGEYRGSVDSGAHELAGQVNYETSRCPNQRIVIGGYSQGAHVVHEALKLIPIEQRNVIDNVVLFGDPKYLGSEYNKYNLLDKPKAYPWVRGTAGLRERGLADAEVPYVPEDMKYKTISWCHEDDFVCTGFSGLSWAITNHELPSNNDSIWSGPESALGSGHKRYPSFGVPEAAQEVVNNLQSQLLPLEIARGGFDPDNDPSRKAYDGSLKNSRPVDLMFAFNKTGGNEDAFFQYNQNLKTVLDQYKENFPQLQTGSVMYTDMAGGSGEHQSSVAAYTQAPNQLSADMSKMFNWSPYIYGGMGGGGDYPENHEMAIERGAMFANWRSNATKHIVIFTERPAQQSYSFNQCDSYLLSQLPYTEPNPCGQGSSYSPIAHPEMCASVRDILIPGGCMFMGQNSSVGIINRTLQDAILLARAKGFEVDIIQPHEARDGQQGYEPSVVDAQLKTLAESTGGLYLKYGVFDEPALRDAIWQILNHQPILMDMATTLPGTYLNFLSPQTNNPPNKLGLLPVFEGSRQLVSVTPVTGARSYGWDTNNDGVTDQLTNGPQVEISSSDVGAGDYITVSAFEGVSTSTPSLSTIILPIVIEGYGGNNSYSDGELMENLDGVGAFYDGSKVIIKWNTDGTGQYDIVEVRDSETGIIIRSVPAINGRIEIPDSEGLLKKLILQYVASGKESDPQVVLAKSPNPVENSNNVGQTNDKIVTQDEPNSTQDPNSPALKKDVPSATPTPDQPAPTSNPTSYYPPEVTQVAGAQDVKTNPQSEVGGIEEANQLFKGEDIGKQSEPIEKKQINWMIILAIGAGVIVCAVLGYLVIKNKPSSDNAKNDQ